MKTQTDWIVFGVAMFFALVGLLIMMFTRPQVNKPTAPTPVNVADPAYPTGDVVYTNGLPSSSGSQGGAGAGGGASLQPAGAPGGGGGRSRPSLGVSGG